MSGLSRARVLGILESSGVTMHRIGKPIGRGAASGQKRIVYLSELERAMPELMASIRYREED
jgi:hypothetical protein